MRRLPNSDIDFYWFAMGVTSIFVGSPRTNKAFGRASCSDDISLGSYGFHYRFQRDRPPALNRRRNAHADESGSQFQVVAA